MGEKANTSNPETIKNLRRLRVGAKIADEKLGLAVRDLRLTGAPPEKFIELLGRPSPWRQLLDAYDAEADRLNAAGRTRLHDAVWKNGEEAAK